MSSATSIHWCYELVCDELSCASRSFEYGIAAAVDITYHVSSLSYCQELVCEKLLPAGFVVEAAGLAEALTSITASTRMLLADSLLTAALNC